jgi:hypothetical protein
MSPRNGDSMREGAHLSRGNHRRVVEDKNSRSTIAHATENGRRTRQAAIARVEIRFFSCQQAKNTARFKENFSRGQKKKRRHAPLRILFGYARARGRSLKTDARRRCERRGVGWQAPRRRRCRSASARSGNAADDPAPPQPLAADGFLLEARFKLWNFLRVTVSRASKREKPDATPAAAFQRPA